MKYLFVLICLILNQISDKCYAIFHRGFHRYNCNWDKLPRFYWYMNHWYVVTDSWSTDLYIEYVDTP
jgi:hypothetical protein